MNRRWLLAAVLALGLVLAPAATAKVSLTRVTSPVRPGAYATLTVEVSRAATCEITVHYKSGSSRAAGLYAKRSASGRVSWTWKVGTRTTPGRWPITVSCGSAGSLRTSFTVQRPSTSPGGGGGGSDCDPNYRGACVPKVLYDLDCADISGTVYVVGVDVHRFDGDGDGVGCES